MAILSLNGAFNYPVELQQSFIAKESATFEGSIKHAVDGSTVGAAKSVASGPNCVASGQYSWAFGNGSKAKTNQSFAIGDNCEVSGDGMYGMALGHKAVVEHEHAFVWQGVYGGVDAPYTSKGDGTFSVNPKSNGTPLSGFYVGDKNLVQHIAECSYATLSAGNNTFSGQQTFNNNCSFNSTVEMNGQTTFGRDSSLVVNGDSFVYADSNSASANIASVGYARHLHSDILSGADTFTGDVVFSNGFSVGANSNINLTNVNLTVKEPLSGTAAQNEPATTKYVRSVVGPVADSLSGFVATSGDEMTGPIMFRNDAICVRGGNDNASRLHFLGGSDYSSGSVLFLCGPNSNVGDVDYDSGAFRLESKRNATTISSLVGRPDGVLKWNGNNIIRSVNINGESIVASDNGMVNLGNIKPCAAGGNVIYSYSSWTSNNNDYVTIYNTGNSVVFYKNNTDEPVMVNMAFNVYPANLDTYWSHHFDVIIKNKNNIETTVLKHPCHGVSWYNSGSWSGLVCSGDEVGVKYVSGDAYPPSTHSHLYVLSVLELIVTGYRAAY